MVNSKSIQPTGRIGSIGGAHNIGETQSQYASVTSQAGIYAGAGGLTVDVGDTTHLTGAVLHSEATLSKNVVKTGTLVMEDIHNVAEYTSKSKGVLMYMMKLHNFCSVYHRYIG
ncbi:hypothetical protein [Veillonella sp. R32]|uniref:hypothetical protein n=1 Tax=Veillonella sp. R32 TaxID=2021312 RepID=UPI00138A425B|nr:hypothetical protein [Veillonella sp. R32]KAF1679186.1 hypothetical protein VER_09600 [Veillonella sp. R32]